MLGVMLQKLWHKKWMVVCLLLGCILLTATVVCFPLYRNAAYNRMLQDEFNNYLAENGTWPAIFPLRINSQQDAGGKSMNRVEEFAYGLNNELKTTEKMTVVYYYLTKQDANSTMERGREGSFSLRPGFLSNLRDHVKILSGEMYSEDGVSESGAIEIVVSEAALVRQNLLVGEEIEFEKIMGEDGKPLRMVVTGVFGEAERGDFYWQVSPDEMDEVCLMDEAVFKRQFTGDNAEKYNVTCYYYVMFDYEKLAAAEVDFTRNKTKELLEKSPMRGVMREPSYQQVLESYVAKRTRISATLFILQIPVLIMLCAFLMMISTQMYEMERNEISVIKSRGASRGQIFRLYLYQSIFLSLIGGVAGLPLGALFCKLLGSAENFLQFNFSRKLVIQYTADSFLYLAAALVCCIVIMTLPAVGHSKTSIVKLKQQRAVGKISWWERIFLDVIFLGISLYGYYTYSSSSAAMTERVLSGESMDPLLYVSSSLFILGVGMLALRLQRVLVRFIYWVGKSLWGPAAYASLMETIKNGRKQQFIMLFMILTISLGMFHATVARTILQNARDNREYLDGADLIVQEVWTDNSAFASIASGEKVEFQYNEPDYSKFASLDGAESYTKVILDDAAQLYLSSKDRYPLTVMGISTKEFGLNTRMPAGLLEQHYYKYLNELAVNPDGVIVSSNMRAEFDFNVGDKISFKSKEGFDATGKILAFIDYWPGYQPTTVALNADGGVSTTKNYLVIANLGELQRRWGVTPYQVWITAKEGENNDFFYEWIDEKNVRVKMYTDRNKDIDDVLKDPLLQGTNGILTLSFIVTIILCAVGYLIYWIMSIRSREMVFGVLRAGGMHKGELFFMLILEQIFSGIFSVFAGFLVGRVSSDMFVPILQNSYAGADQVLPMKLITNMSDLLRLYGVTAFVMAACLLVITGIVFRLNVAKALKLGEE
ncbi:MAG: ABC transporter permease [Agathobacter sp.]|nr:ABC transporter permease [Agathobacter sp.]